MYEVYGTGSKDGARRNNREGQLMIKLLAVDMDGTCLGQEEPDHGRKRYGP